MNLVWIAHDFKMMVVGSTSLPKLYLYNFYLDKIKKKIAAYSASELVYYPAE